MNILENILKTLQPSVSKTMRELLLGKLPVLSEYPVVVQALTYLDLCLSEVNKRTSEYEHWQLILATALITYLITRWLRFLDELDNGLLGYIKSLVFRTAKLFPFLNRQIMKELDKTRKGLEEDIMKANKGNLYVKQMPRASMDEPTLLATVDKVHSI
jgi:hypothetical protein